MKANAHLALIINKIMNNLDILRPKLYPSTFIRCHYRMLLFIIVRKKGSEKRTEYSLSTDCAMPTLNQLHLNKKSSRKKKEQARKSNLYYYLENKSFNVRATLFSIIKNRRHLSFFFKDDLTTGRY